MFKIVKYKNEQNICPLDEFIKELIKCGCQKDVQKIQAYLRLLEIKGESILENNNWAKKLNSTIYELRPKSNRILYFYHNNNEYVLLHGFKKKTQKTPINEINRAINEALDYERRNQNGK
ncbi:MAG: type II toxin-antitoxin system RelE/ParE family toxin [Acholeplasmatales bacterium]|nr:type II toxin-antitoxin system RelE/ParE family toxin [Acholeplasmatales bacterium]